MKHIVAIIFAALALFAPASAADLGRKTVQDVPTYEEANKLYFAGLSIGVHGGIGSTSIDINNPDPCSDCGPLGSEDILDGIAADGMFAGAQAEYLFAFQQNFRLGVYIDGGFANNTVEVFGEDLLTKDSYYGAGLIVGYLPSRMTMIYVKGGYEFQNWTAHGDLFGGDDVDATVGAWVLGLGVRTMIAEQVSLGAGFDYLIYDGIDVDTNGSNRINDVLDDVLGESTDYRGLVRLDYHF